MPLRHLGRLPQAEEEWFALERDHARRPALSAVVPCFNEEGCLLELHRRLSMACREVIGSDYEIVLVNDGSTDRTWPMIMTLSAEDPRVVGVGLTRNHGHELALSAGLYVCRGDRILVMDADLQDPPELLARMMEKLNEGADVVFGQRIRRRGEGPLKRLTSAAFYRLFDSMVDVKIPVDTGDFRLMSRRALDILNGMPEHHRFVRGMISWVGFRQVALPYERDARVAGATKYPWGRLIRLAIDAITGFSIRPLRIASYLGLLFALFGVIGLGYTFYSWFAAEAVDGWTSVMTTVLIMGSVQLLMLGVLGEYLGRTYLEVKRRPLFMIERIVRHPAGGVSPSPARAREVEPLEA